MKSAKKEDMISDNQVKKIVRSFSFKNSTQFILFLKFCQIEWKWKGDLMFPNAAEKLLADTGYLKSWF